MERDTHLPLAAAALGHIASLVVALAIEAEQLAERRAAHDVCDAAQHVDGVCLHALGARLDGVRVAAALAAHDGLGDERAKHAVDESAVVVRGRRDLGTRRGGREPAG